MVIAPDLPMATLSSSCELAVHSRSDPGAMVSKGTSTRLASRAARPTKSITLVSIFSFGGASSVNGNRAKTSSIHAGRPSLIRR